MNRQGLVAVRRTAMRDGKTYLTTVWIRPVDQNKVKASGIAIPDWHFKDANGLVAEVDRIHALKDPSEKNVLKEHLIEDLKKFGITWKEDTGSKADAVNWMRAMMSAKKHLNSGKEIKITDKSNTTGLTAAPTAPASVQPQRQPIQAQPQAQAKVVLGTGQAMSKDDAKKAIQDLQKQLGTQGLMDLAEANGIQWAKNPTHISNSYMQCAMKLSKHIQGGGTLTDTGKGAAAPTTTPQPTPKAAPAAQPTAANPAPATAPAAPPQPVGPKPMTLAFDYHNASPKQKLIGLVTGIIPTDDTTTAYIEDLMRKGMFELHPNRAANGSVTNGQPGTKFQYNLPKVYYQAINSLSGILGSGKRKDDKWIMGTPDRKSDGYFNGTPYEKEYNAYKEAIGRFEKEYGHEVVKDGAEALKAQHDTMEILKDISKGNALSNVSQLDAIDGMRKELTTASLSQASAQKVWDKYGMDLILEGSGYPEGNGVFKSIIDLTSDQYQHPYSDFNKSLRNRLRQMNTDQTIWTQNLINGSINKASAMSVIADALHDYQNSQTYSGTAQVRNDVAITKQMVGRSGLSLMNKYVKEKAGGDHNKINADDFLSYAKEAANDFKPLVSDDATFIRDQIVIGNEIYRHQSGKGLSTFDDYKPMDRGVWENASDKKEIIEEHFYAMRKKGNARDKFLNQKTKERAAAAKIAAANPQAPGKPKKIINTDFLAEWKRGTDPTKLEFPDHDDVNDWAHCSLDKVPDHEAKKVEARVLQTHDSVNHRSFTTKVHGVYRIKNLPYEEEFKKIDAARNNTNFYYHGTDFKATQKILGASGQFVIKPRQDAKAGRMLGDGVYLAEQSSKSMQYVGGQYVPGGLSSARGVLFVCKASLGNVVISNKRGYDDNQPIMRKKETDTVACVRPHVVNPEWAVKEEKAVMPRLWIDVERT